MTLMWNIEKDASGQPIAGKRVTISLLSGEQPAYSDNQLSIESVGEILTDVNGRWELDLEPNVDLVPAGTVYSALLRFRGGNYTHLFTVPDAPGLNWIGDNLSEIPGDLPSGALGGHLADTTAHLASSVVVSPVGGLVATEAQAALAELDSEISQEVVDRISAISTETAERISVDSDLQVQIDGKEPSIPNGTYAGTEQAGVAMVAMPAARETESRQTYRNQLPLAPTDFGRMLTPAVQPFDRSDGLFAVTAFDDNWIIAGEDSQVHVVNKHDLSNFRADREPVWSQDKPWYVDPATKVVGHSAQDSSNTFLVGIERQTWTYVDPGIGITKTTGYAIIVGTGDLSGGAYRPPTVYFYREGSEAVQSLTAMLNTAGIMGGVTTSPRNLMGAARTATDTFFLYGSGTNQSTAAAASRPTFGKMVLTLNSAKTQTGATAVTSLTWTDYLATLQAQMPAGETIVNVAAAGGLVGSTLHVLVTTLDAGNVHRGRMVLFDVVAATATLDAKVNTVGAAAVYPLTLTGAVTRTNVTATIGSSGSGVAWACQLGGGLNAAYYRANAETTWRTITPQIDRCFGFQGGAIRAIVWDSSKSRFVVGGGFQGQAEAGWADADFKQGHALSISMPMPLRWPGDNARSCESVWSDAIGTLVVGHRQLALFVPANSTEPAPTRILWGLRVTATAIADTVWVSEGEALIHQYDLPPKKVYFAGGLVGGLTQAGPPTMTLVMSQAGVVSRSAQGFNAGGDYPEPAERSTVILATITRVATGVALTAAEIDQSTFREHGAPSVASAAESSVLRSLPAAGRRKFLAGKFYLPTYSTTSPINQGVGGMTLVPFWVPETVTVQNLSVAVNAAIATAVVRLGIYRSDSSDRPTGAPLVDTGAVIDASTTGVKSTTTNLPVTLLPGLYWLAAAVQVATVSAILLAAIGPPDAIHGESAAVMLTSSVHNGYYIAGVTGALPTNPSSATTTNLPYLIAVGT